MGTNPDKAPAESARHPQERESAPNAGASTRRNRRGIPGNSSQQTASNHPAFGEVDLKNQPAEKLSGTGQRQKAAAAEPVKTPQAQQNAEAKTMPSVQRGQGQKSGPPPTGGGSGATAAKDTPGGNRKRRPGQGRNRHAKARDEAGSRPPSVRKVRDKTTGETDDSSIGKPPSATTHAPPVTLDSAIEANKPKGFFGTLLEELHDFFEALKKGLRRKKPAAAKTASTGNRRSERDRPAAASNRSRRRPQTHSDARGATAGSRDASPGGTKPRRRKNNTRRPKGKGPDDSGKRPRD